MSQTIYLMRHGQTLFNSQHRIQGWSDSPLTEKGVNQAKIASQYFPENQIKLESAYCSTLERTEDTLLQITDLPYKRLKGLKEWNYGVFEAESDYLYPFNNDANFFPLFGGESDLDVQKRMSTTIKDIVTQDHSSNILIVSHGGAIRSFARAWRKYEANSNYLPYENCCVLKFIYENDVFSFQNMYNHDFSSLES
ncbi:histidine phosphatase family protein [Xylocopilactobacillus apis]|uniref:Phosphoglycerate mutase n=1 Tax=Xylocopilactobacillus apis TaxID=2932183 RepID=A0AAU9CT58_9LACO|nr:histidine phosphatase family protein [Xylocopilactobacillus apis]BDR55536.1 phosphoglycerate mutase [Xylocopilactobacillus apis]